MTQQATQKNQDPAQLMFRALNPIIIRLLRSPLHRLVSNHLILVTFTGRKTGREYTTPVGYAQVDNTLYTGTEGRWARNLRGGAPVRVRLRGEERRGTAEVLSDIDDAIEAYQTIYRNSRRYAAAQTRNAGIRFGPNGEVSRDDVIRAREAGHVVIRITLD